MMTTNDSGTPAGGPSEDDGPAHPGADERTILAAVLSVVACGLTVLSGFVSRGGLPVLVLLFGLGALRARARHQWIWAGAVIGGLAFTFYAIATGYGSRP